MNMKVSEKGLIEIANHEGIVPYPYLDSVGVWTFGIGHTHHAGKPFPKHMTLGKNYGVAYCMELFKEDMKIYEKRVNDAVKVPLEQHEFDALVSFDFNTGGIYRARLTRRLNKGHSRQSVADAFMGWTKPKEIIGRRRKEKALFASGNYSAKGRAPVHKANSKGRVSYGKGSKMVNVAKLLSKPEEKAPEPNKKDNQLTNRKPLKKGNKKTLIKRILNYFKK